MNTRRLLALVLSISSCALGVNACSGTGKVAPSSTSESTVTVGPTGGVVTSDDQGATLRIPAGALTEDVAISITRVSIANTPAGTTAIGPAYRFEPDGLTFASPASLTMALEEGAVPPGMDHSLINIESAPDDSTDFQPLPSSVAVGNHVTASISHFCVNVPVMESDPGTAPGNPGGSSGSVVSDGGGGGPACIINCALNEIIDGGTACDCSTMCAGTLYDVQCICGQCTCYTNGVATGTTTAETSECQNGQGPTKAYLACGYPAQLNAGGASSPTNPEAGVCP